MAYHRHGVSHLPQAVSQRLGIIVGPKPRLLAEFRFESERLLQPPGRFLRPPQGAVPDLLRFKAARFLEKTPNLSNLPPSLLTQRAARVGRAILGVRMADQINVHGGGAVSRRPEARSLAAREFIQ